jgi:hypothetical protein
MLLAGDPVSALVGLISNVVEIDVPTAEKKNQ